MRRVPREDALEAGGARFCRGAFVAGRRLRACASRWCGLAALARAGFAGHFASFLALSSMGLFCGFARVACSRSVLMPFQWFPTQWFLSTELD